MGTNLPDGLCLLLQPHPLRFPLQMAICARGIVLTPPCLNVLERARETRGMARRKTYHCRFGNNDGSKKNLPAENLHTFFTSGIYIVRYVHWNGFPQPFRRPSFIIIIPSALHHFYFTSSFLPFRKFPFVANHCHATSSFFAPPDGRT